MKLLTRLVVTFLVSTPVFAGAIRPFQTDYCTNFPSGTHTQNDLWRECCVQHDLYLWAGGTFEERLRVDQQLKECVISKGAPVPAWIMYLGVRVGSRSPIRYKAKEWGNAWNVDGAAVRNRYQALTDAEVGILLVEMGERPSADVSHLMLQQFRLDLLNRLQGILPRR